MQFNIWNLIYLLLTAMSLGLHLSKHGQKKEGNYNFWIYLIAASITIFVLYKGGLFKEC